MHVIRDEIGIQKDEREKRIVERASAKQQCKTISHKHVM